MINMLEVIPRVRHDVLGVILPEQLIAPYVWPASRYDDEDNVFFTTIGDAYQDFGAVELHGSFPLGSTTGNIQKYLRFMFYAVGWGEHLQCSIVDFQSNERKINVIREKLEPASFHSKFARVLLIDYKMPKSSELRYHFPGSKRSTQTGTRMLTESRTSKAATKEDLEDCTVIVSLHPQIQRDDRICSKDFWSIEIRVEEYYGSDLPPMPAPGSFH